MEELAQKNDLPLIHGGINSWYGQITTIIFGRTPTLKEIFGENSQLKEEIPSFSPVVSIVASLQVIEGIKIMLNKEDILANELLLIDLREYHFTRK